MLEIKANERVDDLQCEGYRIIQNPDAFCFGMDAVLLANYVKMKPEKRGIDLGTGNGVIPLLLAGKHKTCSFTGLEIQEDSADMAKRSVIMNQLKERVEIIEGDIKDVTNLFPTASFDVVTSNPPYTISNHGLENPYAPKNIARHEILCSLEDVVKAASYLIKPKGSFFMVHKPYRLAEIIYCLKQYHLEPKRMRLVHPYVDKEPNMVLIESVKCGNPRITIESPLVVYQDVNVYTDEIHRIYFGE